MSRRYVVRMRKIELGTDGKSTAGPWNYLRHPAHPVDAARWVGAREAATVMGCAQAVAFAAASSRDCSFRRYEVVDLDAATSQPVEAVVLPRVQPELPERRGHGVVSELVAVDVLGVLL